MSTEKVSIDQLAVFQLIWGASDMLRLSNEPPLARLWAEALLHAAGKLEKPDLIRSVCLRLYDRSTNLPIAVHLHSRARNPTLLYGVKRLGREFVLIKRDDRLVGIRALVSRPRKGLRPPNKPTYWTIILDGKNLFYYESDQLKRDYQGLTGQDALNALAIDALRSP